MEACFVILRCMATLALLIAATNAKQATPTTVNLVKDAWNGRVPGLYVASIEFSSPSGSQTLGVAVDTGSSVLLIATRPDLGSSSSDLIYHGTCEGSEVRFGYGAGAMNGHLCNIPPTSSLKLGGLLAGQPAFMGIEDFEKNVNPLNPLILSDISRGILGLSFFKLSGLMDPTFASNSVTPLLDGIVEANDLPNVFGMQLCGQQGGHMSIGGVDTSSHIGNIEYTPITCDTVFCVNMVRVGTSVSPMTEVVFPKSMPDWIHNWLNKWIPNWVLDSKLIPKLITALITRPGTFVDSGNAILQLPGNVYSNVSAVINKEAASAGVGNATTQVLSLRCLLEPAWPNCTCVKEADLQHLPEVWIELQGGVLLKVPPSKYLQLPSGSECYAALMSPTISGGVLGLPLLESYYTVFDKDQMRIGFAPTAGCSETPSVTQLSLHSLVV